MPRQNDRFAINDGNTSRVVWVGNLPYPDSSQDYINLHRDILAMFGASEKVQVNIHRRDNRSFAYVLFETEEQALKAFELHKSTQTLMGSERTVFVGAHKQRKEEKLASPKPAAKKSLPLSLTATEVRGEDKFALTISGPASATLLLTSSQPLEITDRTVGEFTSSAGRFEITAILNHEGVAVLHIRLADPHAARCNLTLTNPKTGEKVKEFIASRQRLRRKE